MYIHVAYTFNTMIFQSHVISYCFCLYKHSHTGTYIYYIYSILITNSLILESTVYHLFS